MYLDELFIDDVFRLMVTRYALGRALQVIGLLVLPFAIASELMGAVGLGRSLLIALGGAVLFYIGLQIQGR